MHYEFIRQIDKQIKLYIYIYIQVDREKETTVYRCEIRNLNFREEIYRRMK